MAQPANAKAKAHEPGSDLESHITPIRALSGDDPPLILSLADLVRDAAGEVVLFNDSGLRALALSTSTIAVEDGVAGRHVTAAGEDVSGFRFIAFADGLRLYYQHGLEVIILDETMVAD
jgi:hypothetical protein